MEEKTWNIERNNMRTLLITAALGLLLPVMADAAPPMLKSVGQSQLAPGDSGIAWYSTWDTGLAEAKRSGRPILFMAAATQCSGVSGVF